uniref:Uncharacterized protein n=1 Tax=Arundo donax TaxID=35708 RepID=A0A0A9B9U5_ARUDO
MLRAALKVAHNRIF